MDPAYILCTPEVEIAKRVCAGFRSKVQDPGSMKIACHLEALLNYVVVPAHVIASMRGEQPHTFLVLHDQPLWPHPACC
jgi:hypothetical protein